jgi:hypothetical protein
MEIRGHQRSEIRDERSEHQLRTVENVLVSVESDFLLSLWERLGEGLDEVENSQRINEQPTS